MYEMKCSFRFALVAMTFVLGCQSTGKLDTDDTDSDTETETEDPCSLGEYEGDYEINDASDIAGLVGYTSINGMLIIDACTSYTDLSELFCLTSVGSSWSYNALQISNNENLTNLNGLNGLVTVDGGYLEIDGNPALVDLAGLGGLTTLTPWGLWICDNDSLTDLDDLIGLTSAGVLRIAYNDNLVSLDGLGGITGLVGGLWIEGNNSLPTLVGLGGG